MALAAVSAPQASTQTTRATADEPSVAPEESARAAGLTHVNDAMPGIRRKRAGRGFTYVAPSGKPVRDDATLARIRALAIPPAWSDVWICPRANGHLQATGRDARGRKQYRYHAEWRRARDETKYHRSIAFAEALPALRARVEKDLARRGLPREKVLATLVGLLERTLIRVGNDEYRRANGSFGLTTLLDHHVEFNGSKACFRFKGKGGKERAIALHDARLARVVKCCRELPGQQLFQYVDDDGARRSVGSADVNAYLREAMGAPFTAKDFRTWAGTVLAAIALHEAKHPGSKAEAEREVKAAIARTAKQLGNTVTVCRKCYVHPDVVDAYLDGELSDVMREHVGRAPPKAAHALAPEEEGVLKLLRARRANRPDLVEQLETSVKQAKAKRARA